MVEKLALVTFREGSSNLEVQHIRDLSKQDFNQINDSISSLISFSKSQSLYRICQVNYEEIWSYLDSVEKSCKISQRVNERILFGATEELNRRIINYLSSFRSFHDYKEAKFKRLNQQTDLLELFKEKTAYYYDNNYVYQFFWRFRNYIQHCGFPVGKLEIVNRSKSFSFVPFLLRDELLGSFDWTPQTTKQFIENQPHDINLLAFLTEFDRCVQDINWLCTKLDLSLVHDSWYKLMILHEEVQTLFPHSLPSLSIFETKDNNIFETDIPGQRVKMSFSRFPVHIMREIQELEELVLQEYKS